MYFNLLLRTRVGVAWRGASFLDRFDPFQPRSQEGNEGGHDSSCDSYSASESCGTLIESELSLFSVVAEERSRCICGGTHLVPRLDFDCLSCPVAELLFSGGARGCHCAASVGLGRLSIRGSCEFLLQSVGRLKGVDHPGIGINIATDQSLGVVLGCVEA